MKFLYKNIDKNSSGSISLIAEGAEDIWHAYNLIAVEDQLKSSTVRHVINESAAGGSASKQRVRTVLTISVKKIDYDTHNNVLSIKGTNIEENDYVKMGAYHTIDLEINNKFTITKPEWDSVALDRIQDACDPSQNADVAAVIMQEGVAHVCLVLTAMTLIKTKIETSIPHKRKGGSDYDKNMIKFFDRIVQAVLQHVNFDVVKAIILASPGDTQKQFHQYMCDYASKKNERTILDNKSKFLLIHSSTGYTNSLTDVLHDPLVMHRLNNTKALGEVRTLDAFFAMQKSEPTRATYGIDHVEKASEAHAIDCLLITDALFRSNNLKERKRFVKIVENVKGCNGEVKIFSSLHVSGEQLSQITGVAAILRFPMLEDDHDLATGGANNTEADILNKENLNIIESKLIEATAELNLNKSTITNIDNISDKKLSLKTNGLNGNSIDLNKSKTATPKKQLQQQQPKAPTSANKKASAKKLVNFNGGKGSSAIYTEDDYDYDDYDDDYYDDD